MYSFLFFILTLITLITLIILIIILIILFILSKLCLDSLFRLNYRLNRFPQPLRPAVRFAPIRCPFMLRLHLGKPF